MLKDQNFNKRIIMLLFSMILWLGGYVIYNGDYTFFSIIAGIMFVGLLVGNLYMTYYYLSDKRNGIKIALLLIAWGINYAVLDPILFILFLVTSFLLFSLNIKLINENVDITKLEYPIAFYFQNFKLQSLIIITVSTFLYAIIIVRSYNSM